MDYSAFGLFILMVGFISLSGVMMPGPVMVAAIAKGSENKHAGLWIALGHLMVEIPLITFIAMGFYYVFTDDWVQGIIGIGGGALLLYMGIQMIWMREDKEVVEKSFPGHPIMAGIVTTISNPYFILWWATIGATLIIGALEFGIIGILAFIIVHEFCDVAWVEFITYSVNKSKDLWTDKSHAMIFGVCGLVLVFFGIYFILAFML
ncbi:MAG: LysE family transporter [Thermoplasmata archaeon]|nr:LysE family transporter [Thermoplasmata archaeon]